MGEGCILCEDPEVPSADGSECVLFDPEFGVVDCNEVLEGSAPNNETGKCECPGSQVPSEDDTKCECPDDLGWLEGSPTDCVVCDIVILGSVPNQDTGMCECGPGSFLNNDTQCERRVLGGGVDPGFGVCSPGQGLINGICVDCNSGGQGLVDGECVDCGTALEGSAPNPDTRACECQYNQIPNEDSTKCEECPEGQIPSEDGTKCEDFDPDFGVIPERGECPPGQGLVDGSDDCVQCNEVLEGANPNPETGKCECPEGQNPNVYGKKCEVKPDTGTDTPPCLAGEWYALVKDWEGGDKWCNSWCCAPGCDVASGCCSYENGVSTHRPGSTVGSPGGVHENCWDENPDPQKFPAWYHGCALCPGLDAGPQEKECLEGEGWIDDPKNCVGCDTVLKDSFPNAETGECECPEGPYPSGDGTKCDIEQDETPNTTSPNRPKAIVLLYAWM